MIDTNTIRSRLADPVTVAGLLGLKYRQGKICCPIHGERNPSCSFTNKGGALVFFCHSCGANGDIFKLVMGTKGISFREAGEYLANLASVGEADDSFRAAKPPPEPPPKYPNREARDIWRASLAVPEGCLRHRIGNVTLPEWSARILPGGPLPDWAQTWQRTGHHLIIPQFTPDGIMRTLLGRRIHQLDDGLPKSMTPKLWSIKGVGPINRAFRVRIMNNIREPGTFLMTEGEIDFLLASAKYPKTPILCIRSGTLNEGWRRTIPHNSRIIIATDLDPAGDKYAEKVQTTWAGRSITFDRLEELR